MVTCLHIVIEIKKVKYKIMCYNSPISEEIMKEAYHEYLMRVSDVINFAGVCRRAGVNYTDRA